MSILEYLSINQVLDPATTAVIKSDMREKGVTLDAALSDHGVDTQTLLEYKGRYYNVPVRTLQGIQIPFEILQYVPEESARHYRFVPIGLSEKTLEIGMVEPDNMKARDALSFIAAKEDVGFKIFVISQEDFDAIMESYKSLSGQVTQALSEYDTNLTPEELELGKQAQSVKEGMENDITEDAPVSKIVATIIRYAVDGNASDVHIEPMRSIVRVRFRVDGTLSTSIRLPMKVHPAIIARIKILTKLKIDEKRKPQDGRFAARVGGRKVDFRVSTFPSYHGEKVVMRILDQDKGVRALDQIGISDQNLAMLRKAIRRPYGMILISGPTGSGKTTTLYSLMKELDAEGMNILSLEDPVEYSIEGVSQSQIRSDIGYTFATGLRTTLRQDPDIIMVGEIRDGETAKLAIQAALTGHLVLSTIHTNSAAGIVPRLINMGVDPYLIPPTLILGVAQRLTRLLCDDAGVEAPIDGVIKQVIDEEFQDLPQQYLSRIPQVDHVKRLAPSPTCPTGTRGREAILEMYEMTDEIEQVILHNPVESAIFKAARQQGMMTMRENAIIKALQHKIPFEEVGRL